MAEKWYDLETAPGQELAAGAAPAWDRLSRRITASYGWVPVLTDSVRPYLVQVRIFLERYTPQATGGGYYGDVRRWNGVRYVRMRGHAAAAVPGTSNHGLGLAVDVSGLGGFGGERYREMASVATSFGWTNDAGRTVNEAWHWQYDARLDRHNGSGGGTPSPVPDPKPDDEEDEMNADEKRMLLAVYDTLTGGIPGVKFEGEVLSLVKAAVAQTGPITRGGVARSLRQEVADTLTLAQKATPDAVAEAVWGVRPTGNSSALEMLMRVKMRLDNGSAPDAAGLAEVTAVDRKVDRLLTLIQAL